MKKKRLRKCPECGTPMITSKSGRKQKALCPNCGYEEERPITIERK